MRYLVLCSYDGTNYYGWQKQKDLDQISVSLSIEKVLSKILNEDIIIHGSGRTDRYVHALKQAFHFDTTKRIEDYNKIKYAINSLLPKDIHVDYFGEVNESFHARHCVKAKTYLYRIYHQSYDVFSTNHALMFNQPLDIKLMKAAARFLVGKHSFINFTTKDEDEQNFVRTIFEIKFKKVKPFELWVYFKGSGFMTYQVRFMMGLLIQIGLHKEEISYLQDLINKTEKREICKYKAEPQGLYLFDIAY